MVNVRNSLEMAIDVFSIFYFAVVFSSMYFRFRLEVKFFVNLYMVNS